MTSRALSWTPVDAAAELRVGLAGLVSFGIHLGLYLLLAAQSARPVTHKPREISLEVHEIDRPKPPPPPPLPEKVPLHKIQRAVAKVEKMPIKAPPPPNTPPPQVAPPQAPAPIHIGVNLESTVSSGDFATAVGNTMYGQAPVQAPAPAAVRPYWAAKYVPQSRVSEIPVLLDEVKAPYPPAARKEGVEGQVILMLTIDDQGKVVEVKRVSGPGHGLDEAAERAASLFRWKPAKYNGVAVSTTIRYVYSFEID